MAVTAAALVTVLIVALLAGWNISLRSAWREERTLVGHTGVESASFSPNGERVVTASPDGTARIWDAETGKQIVILKGHEDSITAAAFSPDGERVVTSSSDGTARLWNAVTGQEVFTLKGHEGAIKDAAFSPDGCWVVTASVDKTARIWPVDILPVALDRRPRELTADERDRDEIGTLENR